MLFFIIFAVTNYGVTFTANDRFIHNPYARHGQDPRILIGQLPQSKYHDVSQNQSSVADQLDGQFQELAENNTELCQTSDTKRNDPYNVCVLNSEALREYGEVSILASIFFAAAPEIDGLRKACIVQAKLDGATHFRQVYQDAHNHLFALTPYHSGGGEFLHQLFHDQKQRVYFQLVFFNNQTPCINYVYFGTIVS